MRGATLAVHAEAAGTVSVQLGSSEELRGVAVVSEFQNVDGSQIHFGQVGIRILQGSNLPDASEIQGRGRP